MICSLPQKKYFPKSFASSKISRNFAPSKEPLCKTCTPRIAAPPPRCTRSQRGERRLRAPKHQRNSPPPTPKWADARRFVRPFRAADKLAQTIDFATYVAKVFCCAVAGCRAVPVGNAGTQFAMKMMFQMFHKLKKEKEK
jgi:hypothetical protein